MIIVPKEKRQKLLGRGYTPAEDYNIKPVQHNTLLGQTNFEQQAKSEKQGSKLR